MEQVFSTVKVITEAGVLVVIAAVFIVISYLMFKKQISWFETLLDDKLNTIKSHDHPSTEDFDFLDLVNDKIYCELRGVLSSLNCDRVYVYLYHNGGVSSSGLFFQRMSCICEVVSQGILPVVNERKALYRGSYSSFCEKLRVDGYFSVDNCDTLKGQDDFLYQDMISRKAKSVYCKSLKDSQGNVVGFIGLDYCSDFHEEGKKIYKTLRNSSFKVSSLVDVRSDVKEEVSREDH